MEAVVDVVVIEDDGPVACLRERRRGAHLYPKRNFTVGLTTDRADMRRFFRSKEIDVHTCTARERDERNPECRHPRH